MGGRLVEKQAKTLAPSLEEEKMKTKYYTWDTLVYTINNDIKEYRRNNRSGLIIIIGHSYGGDTAMDVANFTNEKTIVVTLDPVSTSDVDTYIGIRPRNVSLWINSYIEETWCDKSIGKVPIIGAVGSALIGWYGCGSVSNYIATVGGKWGYEESANYNLEFAIDNDEKVDHANVYDLFTGTNNSMGVSAKIS